MLNTETDVLEESNKDIKEQIQRIHERGQMSEKEKQDLQKALEAECRHLESEIDRNLAEADETKGIFRRVQPHVEKMIKEFSKTKFFLSVAPKQYYETGFTFNESNIVQYLAELEEYIAILITYLATKRDDPSAPFALVPLDKLDTKNHNKKEIAVSPFSLTLRSRRLWVVRSTRTAHCREVPRARARLKLRSSARSSCTRPS